MLNTALPANVVEFPKSQVVRPNATPHRRPDTGRRSTIAIAANAEVFGEGDPANHLYRVESGVIRICRYLVDGERQISAFHFPGDVFGLEAEDFHRFAAEAVTPASVTSIALHDALAPDGCGGATGELWRIALRSLSETLEHMMASRRSAAARVAIFVLKMAERQPGCEEIPLPMSRSDIADYLDMTIETVSRTLTQFREEGVIRLASARRILILDPHALNGIAA